MIESRASGGPIYPAYPRRAKIVWPIVRVLRRVGLTGISARLLHTLTGMYVVGDRGPEWIRPSRDNEGYA